MTLTDGEQVKFRNFWFSDRDKRTIRRYFNLTDREMSKVAYELGLINNLQFRWDVEKEARLAKLIDSRITLDGMAKELGCSRETIKRKKAELFPTAKNYWSQPGKIAELKELINKKLSASEIAKELGGTTRNAVIGKAHRLGLELNGSTGIKKHARGSKEEPANKIDPPKIIYPEIQDETKIADCVKRSEVFQLQPGETFVKIVDHKDSQCRCIKEKGDKVLGYCAKPVEAGSRYCAEHTTIFNRGNPYRVKENEEGQAA